MRLGLSLDVAVPRASSGAAAVTFQAESRPTSPALTTPVNIAGDSIPFGVGTFTAGTYRYPVQLAALFASGTVQQSEVSGMAWIVPGGAANTSPITTQITGSANYATYTQAASGGFNDQNTVVSGSAAAAQAWEANIEAGIVTALSGLTQPWVFFPGPYDETNGPGMKRHAGWRYLLNRVRTLYGGGRAYDLMRALQFRGSTDVSTLDYKNVQKWGGLPLTFRGMANDGGDAVPFSNATLPTAWLTVNTATNTSAGIAAATEIASAVVADPANYAEGTLLQNLNTTGSIPTSNIWRVGIVAAAHKWELIDPLHMSRWGAEAWAQITFDILCANQGSGAPVGCPAELFCAKDAAAGASCGTIDFIGNAAPATVALFDSTNTLVTTLTLGTPSTPVAGKGTIAVTRSASGTLTEGEQQLTLQTTDGSGHVIHSPVDFRIGQASTQTTPRLWLIPGTVGNEDSDFSMEGRSAHGMDDSGKCFVAMYLKPVNIAADTEYILDFHHDNGNQTELQVRISTGGNLNVVAKDSANTLIYNTSTASVFANNQATWVLIDLDMTVNPPTVKGVYNKNGAASNTTININGAAGLPAAINMSTVQPRFFALNSASINDENRGSSPIATRDQFTGYFGNIIVGNGNTGVGATPSVADVLWNSNGGAPVARVPYAAIGGLTPVFDIQGGIGDFLRGGFNQAEPIYGTRRGILALT